MTISKEHRANIEAAIKETEYKYFGMYEFTEAQHNAVDLLVSVAQAMLDDDEAALESRVLAERKPEDHGLPPYPKGPVVGPCVCGGWPGGKCLKCPVIPAHPTPDDASGPAITADVHADAARYRWLRDTALSRNQKEAEVALRVLRTSEWWEHTDAAIDRAMQDKEGS